MSQCAGFVFSSRLTTSSLIVKETMLDKEMIYKEDSSTSLMNPRLSAAQSLGVAGGDPAEKPGILRMM